MLKILSFHLHNSELIPFEIITQTQEADFDIIIENLSIKQEILSYLHTIGFDAPKLIFKFTFSHFTSIFPFIVIITSYSYLVSIKKPIYIYGDLKSSLIGTFAASVLSIFDHLIVSHLNKIEAALIERAHLHYFYVDRLLPSKSYTQIPIFIPDSLPPIPRSLLIALVGGHSFFLPNLDYIEKNISTFLKAVFLNIPLQDCIHLTFAKSLNEPITTLVNEYPVLKDQQLPYTFFFGEAKPLNNTIRFISTKPSNVTMYVREFDTIASYNAHKALQLQQLRYDGYIMRNNENIDFDNFDNAALGLSLQAIDKLNAIAKTYNASKEEYLNVIKVARTIADLENSKFISPEAIVQSSILCILNKISS